MQTAQTIYNSLTRNQTNNNITIQQLKEILYGICNDRQLVDQIAQQYFSNVQQIEVSHIAQFQTMIEQQMKERDQNKQLQLKDQETTDELQLAKTMQPSTIQIPLPHNYFNDQKLEQLQEDIYHINQQLQQLLSEDPTLPVLISRDDYEQIKQTLTKFNISISSEINELQQEQIKQADQIEKMIQDGQNNKIIEQQLNLLVNQLEMVKTEEQNLLQVTKEFNLLQQEHDDLLKQKQKNDSIIKKNQEIIEKFKITQEELDNYTEQFYKTFEIEQQKEDGKEDKPVEKSITEFWAEAEQNNNKN